MTQPLDRVEGLRSSVDGTVITTADAGYEEARRVWNGAIDQSPAAVVNCTSAADVAAAINFARAEGLEIAVRGGAHSVGGLGVCDDGLTIDLRAMNSVTVDPEARRAKVGGGALLSEVDAATQEHGLAVPAGEVGHTGVGGLTLGGGMGWLTRAHGLSIDNLVSAQVVLADGRIVRAADDENADLFWAIRGGGGNFGVVTEFEFQLHPVGPIIHLGMLFFPLEQGADALRLSRDLIPGLPPEVTFQFVALNAPPAPFVPEEHQFRPGYAIVLVGFGSAEQHDEQARRVRESMSPLFELVTPMPYTALQGMFDEALVWGIHSYEKGNYISLDLTDEVIDVITTQIPQKTSPLTVAHLYLLNGAYSRADENATAFGGGRSPRFGVFIIGITDNAEALPAERAWVRGFHEALAPVRLGQGGYINSLSADDADRVRDIFGPKYERLAQIKAIYDPENVFHRNANIRPAAAGDGQSSVPAQRPLPQAAEDLPTT